jgi:phage gp46-like protein
MPVDRKLRSSSGRWGPPHPDLQAPPNKTRLPLLAEDRPLGGDYVLGPLGTLEDENGFESAVRLSLFSHRTAEPSDVRDGTFPDRRGYWGDFLSPLGPDDRWGSRLYLLEGQNMTRALLSTARGYVLESLDWLPKLGLGRVEATVTAGDEPGRIDIAIDLFETASASPRLFRFVWQNIREAA